jgi:PEP-CTERM motif
MRGGSTLEIFYFGGINFPAGAPVPLFPGVIKLPGFFNYSVIQGIRNSEIPLVIFSNTNGQARSAPTAAIPEPSTAFYLVGAGMLAFVCRRRFDR